MPITDMDIVCEDPLNEPVPSPDACPDDVLMPSLDEEGFCRKSGSISPIFAGLCKKNGRAVKGQYSVREAV